MLELGDLREGILPSGLLVEGSKGVNEICLKELRLFWLPGQDSNLEHAG